MDNTLGAIDSNFWSSDTPTSRQVIGLAFTLDRLPDRENLVNALQNTVEHFARLRKRIKSSPHHHLEHDSDFNIQNHLLIFEQPHLQPLEDNIARYFSESLPQNRPPWRLVIFKQKNSAAGLLMAHHAITDGLSLLRVFLHLTNSNASFPKVPAAKILHQARNEQSRIPAILRSVRQLAYEYIRAPKKTALNGNNSTQRQIITNTVSQADISQFARNCSGSINDAYLACVAATVTRYHQKQGLPLASMRAVMPVNMRNSSDTELGNHLTGVGVGLPASLELTSSVSEIRRKVRKLREEGGIGAYYLLAQFTARLSAKWQRRFCEAAARRTSFICTNVPGPQRAVYLAGAQVGHYYGLPALMRNHGVAFCFFNAEQTAYFSIVTDPNIVKDKAMLAACLEDTLSEIRGWQTVHNSKERKRSNR